MIVETCPKCGEPLMDIMLTSNPPIPRKECYKCGWSWTGEPEKIEYKSFTLQQENEDDFISFLKYFVSCLKTRTGIDLTIDVLYQLSGNGHWYSALQEASREYAYEIFTLWDYLPWWAADFFDEWLIKCIDYMDLIKEGEEDDRD